MEKITEEYAGDVTENQPNIILVTADSLRTDHCGFLHGETNTTPTLDKLAQDSLVFENVISPGPRTPSSMPVLWTGEYVGDENRGVYSTRAEKKSHWRERRNRIRNHLERYETTAEKLSQYGYDTGGVSMNPWTDRDTGFDQGFDEFEQIERIPDDSSWNLFREMIKASSKLPKVPDSSRWLLMWPDIYETVLDTRHSLTEPYFLWVFLMDAHQPYFTPREYREENNFFEMSYANARYNYNHNPFEEMPEHLRIRLEAAYRDSVRSVDGFVSQLLSDLDEDDPAFVFHSDHGEAQLEHGTRGHRPELYDENLRVPLLAHNVGVTDRISEQAALRHLPQFLVSIAQDKIAPESLQESPLVVTTEEKERVATRTREWKRIDSSEDWNFAWDTPLDELYCLATDPGETTNLYENKREVAALCDRWIERHDWNLEEQMHISTAVEEIATDTV